MFQAPTLGVVTLSYNQGRFLRTAMRSVAVSDPSRLKYVIVDPGSDDGSRSLIDEHGDRVSVRVYEGDAGPADGLNKGIALLDSDVIGLLNADDFYLPGALDHVLDVFGQRPDIDVLTGALIMVDESAKPRRGLMPSKFSARAYLEGRGRVLQPSTFFSRRVWERGVRFNPENRTCWDGEFLVEVALAGFGFEVTSRPLAAFRVHEESISGSQRLASEYRKDHARITGLIRRAGLTKGRLALPAVILSRLNPLRRARELLLLRAVTASLRLGDSG